MQRVHFHVRVGVFNCQQILAKISFVIFDNVIKKNKKQIECGLAWHWWNCTNLGLIDMFLINLNAEIVACILSFRKSRHKPNLESTSKYGFPPDLGGKMAAFWACACKLSWTLLSPAWVQPLSVWGGKKGEFRDWLYYSRLISSNLRPGRLSPQANLTLVFLLLNIISVISRAEWKNPTFRLEENFTSWRYNHHI